MQAVLRLALSLILAIAKGIVATLDWLVDVTERLMVLGIACVVTYLAWHLLRGPVDHSVESTLHMLSDNWKAVLLLLIPLFYRAAKIFLGKLKKLGPLETEPQEKRETAEGVGE